MAGRTTPRSGRPLLLTVVVALLLASIAPSAIAGSVIPGAGGDGVWKALFDGRGHDLDGARAVDVSPNGSVVFVSGYSWGGSNYDLATVAYDVSGRPIWHARYNGPGNGDDYMNAEGQAVSPDGSSVYVTGDVWNGTSYDYATVAYDADTGAGLWATTYNGGDYTDQPTAIAVTSDGSKVFVTGYSWLTMFDQPEYATVAYDAATGSQLWATRFGDKAGEDAAYALAVSPDGSAVFVSGSSAHREATFAYDAATGTELWRARNHDAEEGHAAAVSPDGSTLYVAGYGNLADSYATIAYSTTTGMRLWSALYDGPGVGFDFTFDLAVSPDGTKVFVTGGSAGVSTDSDFATLAYDATTGAALWKARFNGPANGSDAAYAAAVTPDSSKVIVTGGAEDIGSSTDYVTIAYDVNSGSPQWIARYNGASNGIDNPWDMAVTPDGSVVVVTGSSGVGSAADYATIAYET